MKNRDNEKIKRPDRGGGGSNLGASQMPESKKTNYLLFCFIAVVVFLIILLIFK